MVTPDIAKSAAILVAGATASEIFSIQQAHRLHEQLSAAIVLAKRSNVAELRDMDFLDANSPYVRTLLDFYRENLALARLLDASDLLLHAEGPAAAGNSSPRLGAFNWLCGTAEKQLKRLTEAFLPTHAKTRRATADLDFRITGTAVGSLYVGFALANFYDDQWQINIPDDGDASALDTLRSTIHSLPIVPRFVGKESVSVDIFEALPDPALRDAAMIAAYELAPTGNRGIHTVQISAPRALSVDARQSQELGQPERVVLRESLRGKPMMRNSKHGSFTGILRGVDLDSGRITLRQVSDDINALRASVDPKRHDLRLFLDKQVRIEGQYEAGPTGMPRLMHVERIQGVSGDLL